MSMVRKRRGAGVSREARYAITLVIAVLVALGAVRLVGAFQTQHTATSPPPVPHASGPYAVLVSSPSQGHYRVLLVDLQGTVVAQGSAAVPQCCLAGPAGPYTGRGAIMRAPHCCAIPGATPVYPLMVSATTGRVYYLDGGTRVMALAPGGTPTLVTHVPGGDQTLSGFAVSADGSRIAVAVRAYQAWAGHPNFVQGATLQIYVDDLHGGGHHDEIFATSYPAPTDLMEWPVGWQQSALIVAVGYGATQSASWQNPYGAESYHVASAATGVRQATVCSQGSPSGPIVEAGTVCWSQAGTLYREDWTGNCQSFGAPADNSAASDTIDGALAPDGTHVALPDTAHHGVLLRNVQGASTIRPSADIYPLGWIDDRHLIVASDLTFKPGSALGILDTATGTLTRIDVEGALFGAARDIYLGSLPVHPTGVTPAGLANQIGCP